MNEATLDKLNKYCVFRRIGTAYLANSIAPTPEELRRWRPASSFYNGLRAQLDWLPGLRRREVTIDDHRICYWELGRSKRPAAILLHGFSASKENWINCLYQLSGACRLFVPDIPGFGESAFVPETDYRLPAQADRLAAWFKTLGLERAHWVGSSMGGAIAGIIAALCPEIVETLTLMDSAGVVGQKLAPFEEALIEGHNGLIAESYSEVVDVIRLTTEAGQAIHIATLPPLIATDQIARAPVYKHLFRHMITGGEGLPSGYWAPLVKAPTLILWGDCDRVLHPGEATIFESLIPGSRTEIFQGVGHLPMLEAPFLTARTLKAFWHDAAAHST